ncbi:g7261 [Coccomyxa viridis]|uniref:G7261 protein n=1 Tax=Coccomyxa viridis TaxID=1274662 RepID=A0ABP1FXE4_9CHLO
MLVRNLQGHIFIDRDPKHFALILNFLRDGFAVLPRDEQALTEIMLKGLKELIQPNSGWRPNFATQLRAAAMQQLRGDKLAMKSALDLILWCAYGNKTRAFPGAVSRVNITVYDYAEHIGEALAWTSPSKGGSPVRKKKGNLQAPPPVGGQLLYTHLKQAAMFGGDSNSRWFDRTHRLRHKMIGEAPHLLDPEVLDSDPVPDGKQRGMYYIPSSQGRSPDSAAEFVDSIFEVHKHCTEVGLTEDEQEVRRQALYIIENLNLVNLAMRLCDFKDIHMAVEAKQVPDPRRDERKAETEYPIMVLYDVRLAISLTL